MGGEYGDAGLPERLHLAPRVVAGDPPLMEGVIERGFQYRQRPICCRPARSNGVGVFWINGEGLATLSRRAASAG